ncbi:cytidine deaminase, partial [Vibrio lentus]
MNSRITLALESAPTSMKALLSDIVLADNFDATISKEQFQCLLDASGLSDKEARLALLPIAAAYS